MNDGDDSLSIVLFVTAGLVLAVFVGGFVLAVVAHWVVFMWKVTGA